MAAMVRICILFGLSVLWPALAQAQQRPVDFWIMQSDPALGTPLARGDALNIRLGYRSDRPIRFVMKGRAGGVNVVSGVMSNVAPPYPPGEGEALVWIAFRQPVAIDEIEITALDGKWQPILSSSTPVAIEWGAPVSSREPAAWVTRMNGEQQEAIRHQIAQRDGGGGGDGALLYFLLVGGVLGYFVLQPLTVMWFQGRWRLAALAPLVATVPLFVHAASALAAGGNLWPILLIFCLPVATLYLLALAGVRSLAADYAT